MKMKDKKAEQLTLKQKHKNQLKLQRRNAPTLGRPIAVMEEKPTILIVCEGQNTEPSYFRQFRLSSAIVVPVGEGRNTISLVNRTIQLAKIGNYDQLWCVFDRDDFKESDFNGAISLAEANNFGVAYSNQAFEYWIILHFEDHQGTGMHRHDYATKINLLLKPYNLFYDGTKSKFITEEIFNLLDGIDQKLKKERKLLAIERARRNYNQFDQKNPAKGESSTTVFRLVEELLKYV